MADDNIIRRAYPKNGNGKRPVGRPKGSPNPNGGRKKGQRPADVIVRDVVMNECKTLAELKAMSLTNDILWVEECLIKSDVRKLFFPGDWELVPPSELPDDVAAAISSIKVIRRTIYRDKEIPPDVEVTYQYTFWDKGRASERLSRHLGLYEKDNLQKPISRPQINLYLEQGNVVMPGQLPGPGDEC